MTSSRKLALVVALLSIEACALAQQPSYHVTSYGAPNSPQDVHVTALDNFDRVYASSWNGSNFLSYRGDGSEFEAYDLLPDYGSEYVFACNNTNMAIGDGDLVGGKGSSPLLFTDSGVFELPKYDANLTFTTAINDNGEIVGTARRVGFDIPLIWRNGELSTLPGEYYSADTRGINNAGDIVGTLQQSQFSAPLPCVWRNGVLETLPFNYGYGLGVADGGYVAGTVRSASGLISVFAFRDGQSTLYSLPAFHTVFGARIDPSGTIVAGVWDDSTLEDPEPFVFTGGTAYNLNDVLDPASSDWHIDYVSDINDNGTIVAAGRNPRYGVGNQVLILRPVPEPATLATLGIGLVVAAFRRRRRV